MGARPGAVAEGNVIPSAVWTQSQQDGMEEDEEGKEGVEVRRSGDEWVPAGVCEEFGGPGIIC